MKKTYQILIIPAFLFIFFYGCQPERDYFEDENAKLNFSQDTVIFDTIFTTIGTATKSFKVYNPHNKFIKLEKIQLAGAENSVFRINVDGRPGFEFNSVDIAPEDSIYVFVEATLNPNDSPDILRIQDSITFSVNGNTQDVDLVAWGQDVHLYKDSILNYSTTWVADKPYLILGGILIDSLQTLSIEKGARIYLHRDAGIFVRGTLQIEGTLEHPVVIQGDRLESFYEDIPGQWYGIYFAPGSQKNIINFAEIYNGTFGLWAYSTVEYDEPVLTVSNTEINRMGYNGIFGFGTSIKAYNTVVGDCGNSCLEIIYGGSYEFTHCTFSNYWNNGFSNRKTPAVLITNQIAEKNDQDAYIVKTGDIKKADFKNSIIYGNSTNELIIINSSEGIFNYSIERCITKFNENDYNYYSDPNFSGIFNNTDPKFDSIQFSYELAPLSPAINRGKTDFAINYPYDKKGDSRLSDDAPDLGAFEKITR